MILILLIALRTNQDLLPKTGELTSEDSETESLDDTDEELNSTVKIDTFEPSQSSEVDITLDQTTMFFNKYCEDNDIPSVANRVAEAIVEYEVAQTIPFHTREDEIVDDEIITEEEFLRNIDDEMDMQDNDQSDIEETLDDISETHGKVADEISNHMDMLFDPTLDQSQSLADIAKQQAK